METMQPGICYHLYNHANGDDNLFREPENYRFFLQQYEKHVPPVADTLAYCLMPNHFHLLVRIKSEEALLKTHPKFQTSASDLPGFQNLEGLLSKFISKQFSNLFNSYTKAFNKKYNRKGSLFQKNFKRKEIVTDSYFAQVVAYIHLNPVKHDFVTDINDWEWTSYHQYLHQQSILLNLQPTMEWFKSVEGFRQFHQLYRQQLMQPCQALITKQ